MNTKMEPKLSRIGCALFRAERKITSSPQSMTLIQLRLTLACSSASSRLSLVFTSADGLGHAKTRSRATTFWQVREDAVPDK